jgi:hypothetical protein
MAVLIKICFIESTSRSGFACRISATTPATCGPAMEVDSIKQILINTAIDLGPPGEENAYGWGIIDAYAAVKAAQQPGYVAGDANGNGACETADVVYLINYLFKNGPPPDPMAAGDPNADCQVNCSDVLYLINFQFKNGPVPQYGCA